MLDGGCDRPAVRRAAVFQCLAARIQDGSLGEAHFPETHLIPLVLQVANGQRSEISVFGSDYPTPDGTCIRDYVHVCDLAQAHILALKYLLRGGESTAFNLGSGQGFSVREVIEEARRVTGHAIPAVEKARRSGDPARLVASSEKAQSTLGCGRATAHSAPSCKPHGTGTAAIRWDFKAVEKTSFLCALKRKKVILFQG